MADDIYYYEQEEDTVDTHRKQGSRKNPDLDNETGENRRMMARLRYKAEVQKDRALADILRSCPVCGPRVESLMVPVRSCGSERKSTARVQRFRQKKQLLTALSNTCKRCKPLVASFNKTI